MCTHKLSRVRLNCACSLCVCVFVFVWFYANKGSFGVYMFGPNIRSRFSIHMFNMTTVRLRSFNVFALHADGMNFIDGFSGAYTLVHTCYSHAVMYIWQTTRRVP